MGAGLVFHKPLVKIVLFIKINLTHFYQFFNASGDRQQKIQQKKTYIFKGAFFFDGGQPIPASWLRKLIECAGIEQNPGPD